MSYLIFVRHSLPVVDPQVPAKLWELSAEGIVRTERMAPLLAPYTPGAILTSPEPKALATADIIARHYGLSLEIDAGLREHQLNEKEFLQDKEFEQMVKELFLKKDHFVFGRETALQAYERIKVAVASGCIQHPKKNIIFITHGRILSIYFAQELEQDAFALWHSLKLPDFIVRMKQGDGLIRSQGLAW